MNVPKKTIIVFFMIIFGLLLQFSCPGKGLAFAEKHDKSVAAMLLSPRVIINTDSVSLYYDKLREKEWRYHNGYDSSMAASAEFYEYLRKIQTEDAHEVLKAKERWGIEYANQLVSIILLFGPKNPYLNLKNINYIGEAIEKFDKDRVLNVLFAKNVNDPVKGKLIVIPDIVGPVMPDVLGSSYYLVLYPQGGLFQVIDRSGVIEHVRESFAFARFHIEDNRLIVDEIQSDIEGSLKTTFKKKIRSWPVVMIRALHEYKQKINAREVVIPDSEQMLKIWPELPVKTAKRIYDQAPFLHTIEQSI